MSADRPTLPTLPTLWERWCRRERVPSGLVVAHAISMVRRPWRTSYDEDASRVLARQAAAAEYLGPDYEWMTLGRVDP